MYSEYYVNTSTGELLHVSSLHDKRITVYHMNITYNEYCNFLLVARFYSHHPEKLDK